VGPSGLPELAESGLDAPELAALFREAPQRAINPLRAALKRAAETVLQQEGLAQLPQARLAVVVDQMEEIFTRDGVDAEERERFIAVLSLMARSGLAWVIATMRSDFYPRCAEIPELVALKEGAGQYDLLPPTFAEIKQMIAYPARAAGLRFEVDPAGGERLEDVLHEAAARDPEALPLLEFTLDELYKQRTEDRVLTFAAYRQLGGLEGALARRAEAVLTSLEPAVQAALPSLLRALVTVGHGESELVAGRRVPMASLAASPECSVLIDALIQARLLVTDRADDGQAVLGVAHEALLRHWPRLQVWLAEDRELLQRRERVAAAAFHWREAGKPHDLLLPEGQPRAEAEELLARWQSDLDPGLVEFVEASRKKEFLRARERVTIAAANWREEGKRPDFLLPEGKPLAEAEELLARRAELDAGLVDFIHASPGKSGTRAPEKETGRGGGLCRRSGLQPHQLS
jgi:conflict system STAND superfamily ATPase